MDTIETLLRDTLTAHDHEAPDGHDVLAAVHRRLADRPAGSHRGRMLAVAASVVVVAGAAGAVAVATQGSGHDPHPGAASGSTGSTGSTASTSQPAASSSAPVATSRIAPLLMPFDVGWLPTGTKQWIARRVNVGGYSTSSPPLFDGEYMLNVLTSAGPVFVDVQQMPGGLSGTGFKSGAGRAVTVNGAPGIESVHSGGPGGYELYFKPAGQKLLYVNVGPVNGSTTSAAARWSGIGRQIARSIRIPGTTRVEPTFGIGYVPAGMHVRAFDVQALDGLPGSGSSGAATSYEIGTDREQDASINVGTNTADVPSGTPGRTVQGHATRVADDHGYRTVSVLHAVHGAPVAVAGRVSPDVLYRVADGLVLPR